MHSVASSSTFNVIIYGKGKHIRSTYGNVFKRVIAYFNRTMQMFW